MKRSEIYAAIRDVAKSEMPDVVFVDLQKQQVKRQTENFPLPMPALLVEFKNITYSNIGSKSQLGEMHITLWLYEALVTNSFGGAEMETETLALLDRADEVFEAFHCNTLGGIGNMTRIADLPCDYGKDWIASKTAFKLIVKDKKEIGVTATDKVPRVKIVTKFG